MIERVWLKKMRVDRKLTQLEVAKSSEIKRSYYTMIEQGKRNPSVDIAKKISNVLDFDWTYFFNLKCNEMTHSLRFRESF